MSQLNHIPMRTCIGCRQVKEKLHLVRIVHTPQGVEVDPRGKSSGRGAYLCPSWECWQQGLKEKRLAYALKAKASPEELKSLWQFAQRLKERDGGEG